MKSLNIDLEYDQSLDGISDDLDKDPNWKSKSDDVVDSNNFFFNFISVIYYFIFYLVYILIISRHF